MYKIIYEKENGEVIERVRDTLPDYGIGKQTSMGWTILNILYEFKGKYYTYRGYRLCFKRR